MSAAEVRDRLDRARAEGCEANVRRFLRFRGQHYPLEVQALELPGGWAECWQAFARDEDEAVALAETGERYGAKGLYFTTHNIKPEIASRAKPGEWHKVAKGKGTSGADIRDRLVLYVDVDPDRVRGISATDDEVSSALEVGAEVLERLRTVLGDDGPLGVGFSGNGVGVFVALEALPESPEVHAVVTDTVVALNLLHVRPGVVHIDTGVCDAKRLSPLWGTTKRKGYDAPDRPHRSTGFDDLGGVARRLTLGELGALRDALVSALTREQRAEFDKAPHRRKAAASGVHPTTGRKQSRGPSVYDQAKAADVRELMAKLGRVNDDGQPICPGCGEQDSGVAFVGNGVKCSHNRCTGKGAPGAPGFRTTIDLVMETANVSHREAVKMIGEWFGFNGAAKGRARPAPEDDDDPRPVVYMSAELHENVDDAIAALARDENVYQRAGALVTVVRPSAGVDGEGGPYLARLTEATLAARLTACARFMRYDKRSDAYLPAVPSRQIAMVILGRESWEGIRPIRGIVEAPMMRPDGTILEFPGYDAATGYLYEPDRDFEPVPEAPTQADAAAALRELGEPFAEFPYVGDVDVCVTLAAVLTMIVRPAIAGAVPSFVFDASTAGSGKSLQTHAASVIATGRAAVLQDWPEENAELKKTLDSLALMGAPIVTFDNVERPYGGGVLNAMLTNPDRWRVRVLGESKISEVAWRTVIVSSGNNVEVAGDAARRVVVSRLEPKEENPEDREGFKRPHLLEWIKAERPRLVRAALTVLRAFVVAGRPMTGCRVWGSFEDWSRLVPPAIVFAGGVDIRAARPSADIEKAPDKLAIATLARVWAEHFPNGASAREAIDLAYGVGSHKRFTGPAPELAELRDAIEHYASARGGTPSHRVLGHAIGRERDRVAQGGKFVRRTVRGVPKWSVEGDLGDSKQGATSRTREVSGLDTSLR